MLKKEVVSLAQEAHPSEEKKSLKKTFKQKVRRK